MDAFGQRKICVIDENPIHLHAFESVLVGVESVQLATYALADYTILAGSDSDLVLLNMEHAKQCASLMLHRVLDCLPGIPVMCYSATGRPVSHATLKEHGKRLIRLSYGRVIHGLREYTVSVHTGRPFDATGLVDSFEDGCNAEIGHLSPRELDVLCLVGKGHGTPRWLKYWNAVQTRWNRISRVSGQNCI